MQKPSIFSQARSRLQNFITLLESENIPTEINSYRTLVKFQAFFIR